MCHKLLFPVLLVPGKGQYSQRFIFLHQPHICCRATFGNVPSPSIPPAVFCCCRRHLSMLSLSTTLGLSCLHLRQLWPPTFPADCPCCCRHCCHPHPPSIHRPLPFFSPYLMLHHRPCLVKVALGTDLSRSVRCAYGQSY